MMYNELYYDEKANYAQTVRIYERMTELGLTIPKLAKLCEMRESTLRHKLGGRGQFHIMEQARISIVLKFSPQEEYEIFIQPYNLICGQIYAV